MQSVLRRAHASDIVGEPFPHLVIHEALETDYYNQLAAEFPAAEIILNGRQPVSNKNFRYAANDALDDPRISPRWREFIRRHVSQEFFHEVCTLFGSHIRALNPGLEASVSKELPRWESSVRFREPIRDVALECQFAYGTPVAERSRTIGPHVDREVALYAGLLYLRDEEDDSAGGDLELYRFTDDCPAFAPDSRLVPDDRVTRFRSIGYAQNTFVFFLHSPKSLHGVSPRGVTTFPRRHINFVGELTTKVFDLSPFATLAATNPSQAEVRFA
jgi:hypothetical protein